MEQIEFQPSKPVRKRRTVGPQRLAQAMRCQKYARQHEGVRIINSKAKKPEKYYQPGDFIIYECKTTGEKASLKCMQSGRWEDPPVCPPYINNGTRPFNNSTYSNSTTTNTTTPITPIQSPGEDINQLDSHNVTLVLAFVILILSLATIIAYIIYTWRKKQQNRARWKKYFTDYKYRHSRTHITIAYSNDIVNNNVNNVPVTDL